ncbi:D-alanyl-D-alanine carboxypeptidase [Anaplasmataceae bacterium AB001_6]|nr:D-alanyl-D-alanine carboxypeptidase [Anaplasmataceae bacterium AB001_6]
MNFNIKSFLYVSFVVFSFIWRLDCFAKSNDIETSAEYAVIIDDLTGQILFEKNSRESIMPASMSKLMTLYLVFSAIDAGQISLDDKFTVSEEAWKLGGSTMFLEIGEKIKIIDLIRGAIIVSGNDATVTLAEGLSGSQELFVKKMNEIAPSLGLMDSHFTNVSGWPDACHQMSIMDIAKLSKKIFDDFPQYRYLFLEKGLKHNSIYQPNTNTLLKSDLIIDGLKTGSSSVTGFGITVTAVSKKGRRVFVVLHGLKNKSERDLEAKKLLNYALNMFDNKTVVQNGSVVFKVDITGAKEDFIDVISTKDINIVHSIYDVNKPKINIHYTNNIPAPIRRGDNLGFIEIEYSKDNIEKTYFFAQQDIKQVNWFYRKIKGIFMNN